MTRAPTVVAGAGLVGLAVARALQQAGRERVTVLEAEERVGSHQSGHNSGVVHAGLYYRPGSLKARLCAEGRELLARFCEERGIRFERCGKLVVAAAQDELGMLDELERRGRANGLLGMRRLGPAEMREREPHAAGAGALLVTETGIVDYPAVAAALAKEVGESGGDVLCGARLLGVAREPGGLVARTTRGDVAAAALVACAGLQADRVARACGLSPAVRIVPFRGDYHELAPGRRSLVRHLVYPVPDPRFPFLGVHLTRRVDGSVEAGPNAAPALSRSGYSRFALDARDAWESLAWPGTRRLFARHWRMGLGEMRRSLSREAFAEALRRLVPEIRAEDLRPAGCGLRAQALTRDGALVDDFLLERAERQVHVLNAPSPAATACLAIGREIAAEVLAAAP